jgi:hypothetical protein
MEGEEKGNFEYTYIFHNIEEAGESAMFMRSTISSGISNKMICPCVNVNNFIF